MKKSHFSRSVKTALAVLTEYSHLANRTGTGQRHHQSVDPQRNAGGAANDRQQRKEFFIERIVRLAKGAAFGSGRGKARALFFGIAKLGEGIRQLDSIEIKLPLSCIPHFES